MSRRVCSRRAVTVASVATVGTIAALCGVLAAGPAAASGANGVQVSKELTYTCEFPLIGPQPVDATVSVDLPTSAAVGARIQPENLRIDFTLSENIVTAFRLIGAATLEADAEADVDVAFAPRQLTIGVPNLHAPKQDVPASGTMTSSFTGPMPSFILTQAGNLELRAGSEFFAHVTALDENGQPTPLGNPIEVSCTQNPGQDTLLGTIAISGPNATPVSTLGRVEKQLTYSCTFPEAGQQDVQGLVTATFPDQITVGQRAAITDASVAATFNTASVDVLRNHSAATVGGDGQVDLLANLTDANGSLALTLGLPVTIPSVAVPATGELTANVPVKTPTLIFRAAGSLSVSAGDINGRLTPLNADGQPTDLGTFPVPCQPVAGQDTLLATVPIN